MRSSFISLDRIFEVLHLETIKAQWCLFLCSIFLHIRGHEKTSRLARYITKNYPKSARAHCWIGCACQQREKYAEAVPYFEQALRLQPDCAAAHAGMGWSELRLGHVQEALNSFQRAFRID